jgi:hypothetical protein
MFQLVWMMYVRITTVLIKFALRRVEGFKMGQKATITFCVILKETATKTFGVLKSAYGEEQMCLCLKDRL